MTNPSPFSTTPVQTQLSTPLIFVDLFVEVLRERFQSGELSDPSVEFWRWSSDDKSTKLFIESGFNENAEVRGKRPGLWVDRLQNIYGKVSVGAYDQRSVDMNIQREHKYMMGELDMIIDCTSPNRGESMVLGSIVQDFIQMTAVPIMEVFAIRDISPVVLSRTEPFDRERTLWTSPVSFRVNYEARWVIKPYYPLLNSVALRLQDKLIPESIRRVQVTDE